MARRSYTPEQTINKLREAEILLSQAETIAVISKKIGVSAHTYYRRCFIARWWLRWSILPRGRLNSLALLSNCQRRRAGAGLHVSNLTPGPN